jgi:outer membrane lipoprotein-sorting protein
LRRRGFFAAGALLLFAGCATTTPLTLDAQSGNELAHIEAYLNSLHSMRADFVQLDNNGDSHGVVWLQRPGRLRLDYAPPSQSTLVAANGQVVLHDGATDATTFVTLSRTSLAMLLGPDITLHGPVTLTGFQQLPHAVRVTLVRTANPGQGSLTLTFQNRPLSLQEVLMVDAHGDTTRLVLSNLTIGTTIPAAKFSQS